LKTKQVHIYKFYVIYTTHFIILYIFKSRQNELIKRQ